MKNKIAILAFLAISAAWCRGAVSVTASRDYVDRHTELHPVTEDGGTNVVGYFVGTQTNKVLVSEYGAGKNTPGDYHNVSNAAMNARSKADLNVYTNMASESESPIATGDMLATTGGVAEAMSSIKTDLITDGTNTIDAAGNVSEDVVAVAINYYNSAFGMLGLTTWKESDGQVIAASWENQNATLFWMSGSWNCLTNDVDMGGVVGTPYDVSIEIGSLIFVRRLETNTSQRIVGKLALTNDIPPVVAPSTNAAAGSAAEAKAVGMALCTGFTEWVCVPPTYNGMTLHVKGENDGEWNLYADDQFLDPPTGAPSDATSLTFSVYGVTATRRLVTPTKTSQLTNDGTNGVPFAVSNPLAEKVFDFSDMKGVYMSLSNIVTVLGGSITNFPSFNQ